MSSSSNDIRIIISADGRDYEATIRRAEDRTRRLGDESRRSSASASHFAGSLKLLAGAFAGMAVGAAISELYQVNAEFQKLNASLVSVTGSQAGADAAFEKIKSFASETPYDLQQVTGAFIQLKNLGLDPSTESLRSYGNTASAMGKDLNDMIEAVADAATGEFERLKEFGIKSASEGENVTFTFAGVKTTVRKEASAIEGYLQQLGNVQFAGGMKRQMDTLGGAASNLGDAWDSFVVSLGESGFNEFAKDTLLWMGDLIKNATLAVEALNAIDVGVNVDHLQRNPGVQKMEMDQIRGLDDKDELALQLKDRQQQFILLTRALEQYKIRARDSATPSFIKKQQAEIEGVKQQIIEVNSLLKKFDQKAIAEKIETQEQEIKVKITAESGKKFGKLLADLEKQKALYDETGQAAKIRYEIEQGALQNLAPAQQAQLLSLATSLDTLKLSEEQATAAERDRLAILDEGARLTESLRTEEELRATKLLEYQSLLSVNAIDQETYDRALEQMDGITEKASDMQKAIESAIGNMSQDLSKSLTDMVLTGEDSFGDMLQSWIRMLMQMVIQKQIVEPLLGINPSGGGAAGGGGGSVIDFAAALFSENGNVVSSKGAMKLNQYANGGIANSPQLSVFGEGRQPEAYVPLPDGRSIPVTLAMPSAPTQAGGTQNIKVELVNSGGEKQVKSAQPSFDAEGLVIRVFTDDLSSNGPISNQMQGTYGLERSQR